MEHVGRYLAYLYLLRVPLFAWFLLLALPIAAVSQNAALSPLLKGLFDLGSDGLWQTGLSFFLVTTAALLASATVGIIARLILLDGEERLGAGAIPRGNQPGAAAIRLLVRLIPLLTALWLIWGTLQQTVLHSPIAGFTSFLTATVGIGLGLVAFYYIMTRFHDRVWDAAVRNNPAPQPRLTLGGFVDWVVQIVERVVRFVLHPLQAFIVTHSPAGYVDAQTQRLKPRHVFALIQLVISVGFYLSLFYISRPQPKSFLTNFSNAVYTPPTLPTLCLLLVLIMMASWALSALTFFFDRFRIPVLLLLTIWAWTVSFFPQSDHFYGSVPNLIRQDTISPVEVLASRTGKPVILVATSGGGIQSAAWTARVLAGLRQELETEGEEVAKEFDRSIRLISSVSGGSVGAMYMADAYQSDGSLPAVGASLDLYRPLKRAEGSSLDSVAWGLVYPDLAWTLFPFLKGVYLEPPFSLINGPNLSSDHGASLDEAWKRTEGLKAASLNSWRADVRKGIRPAVIFNATIVETGERMLLSTTDLQAPNGYNSKNSLGWKSHSSLYPSRDIAVVTAARLSATFPVVTPAARITQGNVFESEYHIVDGGYYDNHGVASLVEWLDQGMRQASAKPSRILILQIRGSPAGLVNPPAGDYGWFFQISHAVQTLANVRGTAQYARNEIELRLVKRLCDLEYKIPCEIVSFEFDRTDRHGKQIAAPLSWHLTPTDIEALKAEWLSHCPAREIPSEERPCDKVLNFLQP